MTFHRASLLTLGFAVCISASAVVAQAADIEASANGPWTGFYVGAQAGFMQGVYSNSDICAFSSIYGRRCAASYLGADIEDATPEGLTAGGYLGFNYRVQSVVMGLEGDWNMDTGEDSNSFNTLHYTSSLEWDASIRARLGVVLDERALLYVTGGPSWLNTKLDTAKSASSIETLYRGDSGTEFGWVLGAGAEYALSDRFSVKAEYLHGWYGNADLTFGSRYDGYQEVKGWLKQDLQTNVVRAGIAYHFGGL